MWIFPQFSTLKPNFESLVYCHDLVKIFLESLWLCGSKMPQNSFSKQLFVKILTVKSSSGGSDFVVFADRRRKKNSEKKKFSPDQLTLDKNPRMRFFVFMFWWNAREDLSLGATMLSKIFFFRNVVFFE